MRRLKNDKQTRLRGNELLFFLGLHAEDFRKWRWHLAAPAEELQWQRRIMTSRVVLASFINATPKVLAFALGAPGFTTPPLRATLNKIIEVLPRESSRVHHRWKIGRGEGAGVQEDGRREIARCSWNGTEGEYAGTREKRGKIILWRVSRA